MPTVKFVKEKKEVEVPEGTSIRNAAIQADINVHQGLNGLGAGINKMINCHGLGQCGTCRVLVTKGAENATSMGMLEKAKFAVPVPDPMPCFAYIGNEDTMRLSCCAKVTGDLEVETGPEVNLFGENFFS